jgi:peptidoglycan-associated lipoprotein
MIQIQPGRGGWRNSVSLGLVTAMVVALAALSPFALGGCAARKKPAAAAGKGAGGLGEQGLGGKSSLEQFQKGTLGAAGSEGGPLTDIHFDYNDFTIRPQDGEILKTDASWLSSHPNARVQIEGHCDERGSEEYNIALGAKRAQAAKDYLITLGIGGGRLSTISYGKELPLCTDHNEKRWARNRRDHFVVSQ